MAGLPNRSAADRPPVCIVTLGCPKNAVDSESMAALLRQAGHELVTDPERAGVVIVNTCAFIRPARHESLNVLRQLGQAKAGSQRLVAAGCLAERWQGRLSSAVPGVDALLGTRRWSEVAEVVGCLANGQTDVCRVGAAPAGCPGREPQPCVRGPSAYLKIADGCRRHCAFCAIPLIKGPTVSRPMAAILDDVRRLRDQGVREVVLIAQETTDYGRDLGLTEGLAELLTAIAAAAPDLDWLRILYAHPSSLSDRLIAVMAELPQVVPYLDLPLQHADGAVLRAMGRPSHIAASQRLIERLRTALPGIALRSTFIVGYPGESEAAFRRLLAFVETMRFDHVGVFCYSPEVGTPAASLGDPIPQAGKEERRRELLACQQAISLEHHRSLVGRTLDVLVEGRGDGVAVGRTYRDAPEVDGLTVVTNDAPLGSLVPVRIQHATAYDLFGQRLGDPNELSEREEKGSS